MQQSNSKQALIKIAQLLKQDSAPELNPDMKQPNKNEKMKHVRMVRNNGNYGKKKKGQKKKEKEQTK